jgi:hypothetical protein
MVGACGTYGREKIQTKFWLGSVKEINLLDDPDLDVNYRIILKWRLQEQMSGCRLEYCGCCEYGNEHSVSTKCREFLD